MHPGPVNRGVELSGEVVDSPQAVITAQVEAGVVVRMAVLYELLAGMREPQCAPLSPSSRDGRDTARPGTGSSPANLLLRDAHVLDPRAGIDARHDVSCRDGEIAELGEPGTLEKAESEEVVEAKGRRLLPAFFDPHVHLRTPGQEHKEDLETGTRAAAAGGFGGAIAMPNTDPVLDSAPLLRVAARRGGARSAHTGRLSSRRLRAALKARS